MRIILTTPINKKHYPNNVPVRNISNQLELIKGKKSFLVGYYGGGNFGDELLLELFLMLLSNKKDSLIKVYYQNYRDYHLYHHDYNAQIIDGTRKYNIIKETLSSDSIIVGGGGIWGIDFGIQHLLYSLYLFLMKHIFGKRIYLLGVGYYKSTSKLGHIGAYLAAKSSKTIIARDYETYKNFSLFNITDLYLDKDVAFLLNRVNNSTYKDDLKRLSAQIEDNKKIIFFTIRGGKSPGHKKYLTIMDSLISKERRKMFYLLFFEPEMLYPEKYSWIRGKFSQYPNVKIIDFTYNPVALYLLMKKNNKRFLFIGPQYHGKIVSHMAGVKFFPLAYDNKCIEFLNQVGIDKFYKLDKVNYEDIKQWLDQNY